MKAKFGMIVVAGSGKIGGHVASRNRAGAYFRTKVTPINPQTTHQAGARSRLTDFSQSWRSLTEAQRQAWNGAVGDYAKTDIFGDLKNPTGFNLYQKLNNNLQIIGGVALVLPPLPSEVYAPVTLSLTATDAGVVTATFTPPIPAGQTVKVFATPSQSAGKSFVKSEYRLITVLENGDTSPHLLSAAYVARFGNPIAGQKVFLQFRGVNETTGQEGTALSAVAIVS